MLLSWLDHCRWLYNGALEERRNHFKRFGEGLTKRDQQKSLTILRDVDPEWAAVPAIVERSALARLDKAYQGFFRRVSKGEKPGFPRFKGRDRYNSFDFQSVKLRIENSRVKFTKLGWVRFHQYRPLKGKLRNVEVTREKTGRWFVLFQCDIGEAPPKVTTKDAVGIDLGLSVFAKLSNGEGVDNPRFGKNAAEVLARRQRALARKKKSSRSRQRAKVLVAKAYLAVRNQRLDFCRKTAKLLLSKYDAVACENLQIRNMVKGLLGKSINDAAWGTFLHALHCKAEEAGKWVLEVDPRGTTQRCSQCGQTVSKGLSDRWHTCTCGFSVDRDLNAALNIQKLGVQKLLESQGFCEVNLRRTRKNAVRPKAETFHV